MLGIHVGNQRRPRHPGLLRRQRRRKREDVVHHHIRPQLLEQRRKRHGRIPSRRPIALRDGANTRYSSAAWNSIPASSSTSRHFSHVSNTTRWPRSWSAPPSAIPGKRMPGIAERGDQTFNSRSRSLPRMQHLSPKPAPGPKTAPTGATPQSVRNRRERPTYDLRLAVERLPQHTKEAMLRGIETNRIIVGAYVDSQSGGICPMLAAHRNGARTSVANFARAWDTYTCAKRPRRATRREVRTLRSLLEWSLDIDSDLSPAPSPKPPRRSARSASSSAAPPRADAHSRRHRRAPPRPRAQALPRLGVDAPHQAPRRIQGPPRRRRGTALRAARRRAPRRPRASSATRPRRERPSSPQRRAVARAQEHDLGHQARRATSSAGTERDSAMSSGRIIASASTCPLTKSVIGVSTKPGQSAVT